MFRKFVLATLCALGAGCAIGQVATERFTLDRLVDLALSGNRSVLAARDQIDAARAGLVTAGAYPNPEIEAESGPVRPRFSDGRSGSQQSVTLTQKIDLPWQRRSRQEVASANVEATHAAVRAFEADTVAQVKLRYYELLRREAETTAAREELSLMAEIRRRVSLRAESGEAPRYELIKADAEYLNAQKHAQASALRVEQARANLRRAVGGSLPARFEIAGELDAPPPLPSLDALRSEILARNPDLARARAEAQRADRQLELERRRRLPELALKAGMDQDPDMRGSRVGIVVSIPLWDRRAGPIGEAAANRSRALNEREQQEFAVLQALETAWQQHAIATTQVAALEGGILRQAEAALKVAEAAYRFGERGILDYLDAQRVYRAARSDLIAARYELRSADIEIARLLATPKE